MADAQNPVKKLIQLDKRVLERQIARGALTQAEFDAYLEKLPDLESQADNIATLVYGANPEEA